MNNQYQILKEKLSNVSIKNSSNIDNLSDLQKRFSELSSKFIEPSSKQELNKVLKEKLIEHYEEEKDNITFGTYIEKVNDDYYVSMIIFDSDYTYSNLLQKKYSTPDESKTYYDILKNTIKNNDINSLSLYILENM